MKQWKYIMGFFSNVFLNIFRKIYSAWSISVFRHHGLIFNRPAILGLGVEIWLSELKFVMIIPEYIYIALLNIPINPVSRFDVNDQNTRWPPAAIWKKTIFN